MKFTGKEFRKFINIINLKFGKLLNINLYLLLYIYSLTEHCY